MAAGGAPPAHAEQHTVPAAASWQGRVRIFVTGMQQAFLVGTLSGRLVVEQEPRTLDGAQIACPGAVETDYAAGTQHGDGRCIVTTTGGDRLFARWTCAGVPDKGCAGRFVLTGGTGAFQGVTGTSEIVLQMLLSEIIQLNRQEAEYDLTGIVRWPGLTYGTP
jgi:hypothetical protein